MEREPQGPGDCLTLLVENHLHKKRATKLKRQTVRKNSWFPSIKLIMEIEIVYWIFKYLKCGNARENPFVDCVIFDVVHQGVNGVLYFGLW